LIDTNEDLAALLPINMGNRGHNVLDIRETFQQLSRASKCARFISFHPRISGNFVFGSSRDEVIDEAIRVGQVVTELRCLARRFSELRQVDQAMPKGIETTKRGSVVLRTSSGMRRVIYVALSRDIPIAFRDVGQMTPRISIISWPSERDVLCLYDRPGESGDVGQVTRAVVTKLNKHVTPPEIYGTGRAMGVIRDILSGNRLQH
jgi:hypothetical protein